MESIEKYPPKYGESDSNLVTSVSHQTFVYEPSAERLHGENICKVSYDRGKRVLRKTLANHVLPEYWSLLTDSGYFFCSNRYCPVVYFNNQSENYFGQDDLRSKVTHKMDIRAENRPMCYCKNVLEEQILEEVLVKQCCQSIKDSQQFTQANTGKECVLTNPSGRCCGSQIKEVLEWAKKEQPNLSLTAGMSCCSNVNED